MKKKFFSVLLCAAILTCSVSSCGMLDNSGLDSSLNVEHQTIKPPDKGWTLEELVDVTYICDRQLELPMTFGVLGEGFDYTEDESDALIYKARKTITTGVTYSDKYLGTMTFGECTEFDEISSETYIQSLLIAKSWCEVEDCVPISINGVELGSTKNEVMSAMGSSDEEYNNGCSYIDLNTKERMCRFLFNSDDIVTTVVLLLD